METLTSIPVLVLIVGLVLYFATEGKVSETGRIMFAFSLLILLAAVAGKSLL